MKERKVYGIYMTDDDINNVRVAFGFIRNAFVTHLRHTADHNSVMSVMGTLGHMMEELDMQVELNEHDKIAEQIDKLLKEVQDDH